MNATDNKGRAILRITMAAGLPGWSANKPVRLIGPAGSEHRR
jgi:hypothetical protein